MSLEEQDKLDNNVFHCDANCCIVSFFVFCLFFFVSFSFLSVVLVVLFSVFFSLGPFLLIVERRLSTCILLASYDASCTKDRPATEADRVRKFASVRCLLVFGK